MAWGLRGDGVRGGWWRRGGGAYFMLEAAELCVLNLDAQIRQTHSLLEVNNLEFVSKPQRGQPYKKDGKIRKSVYFMFEAAACLF